MPSITARVERRSSSLRLAPIVSPCMSPKKSDVMVRNDCHADCLRRRASSKLMSPTSAGTPNVTAGMTSKPTAFEV